MTLRGPPHPSSGKPVASRPLRPRVVPRKYPSIILHWPGKTAAPVANSTFPVAPAEVVARSSAHGSLPFAGAKNQECLLRRRNPRFVFSNIPRIPLGIEWHQQRPKKQCHNDQHDAKFYDGESALMTGLFAFCWISHVGRSASAE